MKSLFLLLVCMIVWIKVCSTSEQKKESTLRFLFDRSTKVSKFPSSKDSKGKKPQETCSSRSQSPKPAGYLTLLADFKNWPKQDLRNFRQNKAFDYDFTVQANMDYLMNIFKNFETEWTTWDKVFQSSPRVQDHIKESFVRACQEIRKFVGAETTGNYFDDIEKRISNSFSIAARSRSKELSIVDCSLAFKERDYVASSTAPSGKFYPTITIQTQIAKMNEKYEGNALRWPDESFAIILNDVNRQAYLQTNHMYKSYECYRRRGYGQYRVGNKIYHPMDMIMMEEGTKKMTVLKYHWCWLRNRVEDPANPRPPSPYVPAYGYDD